MDQRFQLKLLSSDIDTLAAEGLNRLFNTLLALLVPQINNHLNKGVPLPLVEPYFNLSRSEVSLLDQHIRLDFDPEPCAECLEKLAAQLFGMLKESYSNEKSAASSGLRVSFN